MIIGHILTWVVVLALCWFVWQLLRQQGRLLVRLEALEQRLYELEFGGPAAPEGLPVGTVAPEFDLPDLAGERRTLDDFRAQPLLLIFFNPGCGYCREMAPKLAALARRSEIRGQRSDERGQRPEVGDLRSDLVPVAANGKPLPVIITTGDAETNRQFFSEHKISGPVLLQPDGEVAKAYQANGTPIGYLIDTEGKIASELAIGADALLALADGQRSEVGGQKSEGGGGTGDRVARGNRPLAGSKLARNGLKAGTPAPAFRLPRLDDGELALEELRGSRVLLVFSDPHCGPCEALAPHLEQLHREQPELRVVVISRGEPEENRAKVKEHGLTYPVVLQRQWEISRHYAMFATPIAYLIDEAGLIARDVAVGEEAIRALVAEASAPAAVAP